MPIGTRTHCEIDLQAAHTHHIFRLSFLICGLFIALVVTGGVQADVVSGEAAPQAAPTPTPDPLATPVMPEHPTPLDIGRNSYYYNCMPCHGDKGQGLTAEWRAVWVEDHQNCWGRGCHGGGSDDEGFPIPRDVPAVNGALARFRTSDALYEYLLQTHPPQRPGALSDEEYRALATYLFHEAGRLPETAPDDAGQAGAPGAMIGGIALGLTIVALSGLWLRRTKRIG